MIRLALGGIAAAAVILGMAAFFLFVLMDRTDAADCQKVTASWYGPGFHGRKTASGERFNQNAMTAAHKTLPFGTKVRVTYRGQSVVVRITDRGPFIKGRTLDLSKAAAERIGLRRAGHGAVCMKRL
jgi:rare lipoprotein A